MTQMSTEPSKHRSDLGGRGRAHFLPGEVARRLLDWPGDCSFRRSRDFDRGFNSIGDHWHRIVIGTRRSVILRWIFY